MIWIQTQTINYFKHIQCQSKLIPLQLNNTAKNCRSAVIVSWNKLHTYRLAILCVCVCSVFVLATSEGCSFILQKDIWHFDMSNLCSLPLSGVTWTWLRFWFFATYSGLYCQWSSSLGLHESLSLDWDTFSLVFFFCFLGPNYWSNRPGHALPCGTVSSSIMWQSSYQKVFYQ